MGDEANDFLKSFKLTATQLKSYDTVKTKFEGHFIICRNVIFERAKFIDASKRKVGRWIISSLHSMLWLNIARMVHSRTK